MFGGFRLVRPGAASAKAEDAASAAYSSPGNSASPQQKENEPLSGSVAQTTEPSSSLQLSEDEQRSIGLQTTTVQRRSIRGELVATATVDEPETQLANVSARIGGRIDKNHDRQQRGHAAGALLH